jgi:hypothetical protein
MSPATTENQANALRGMEKAGTVMIADTADFSVSPNVNSVLLSKN